MISEPAPDPIYRGNNSIWQDSRADLFSDLRASRIGDTVTVKIFMKDKASLANDSERKRDASNSLDLGFTYGATSSDITIANGGELGASANSKTKTKSEGGIERSEKIDLLVAAVVSDVLPERQPRHQRDAGSARQLRNARAERRRHRASASTSPPTTRSPTKRSPRRASPMAAADA